MREMLKQAKRGDTRAQRDVVQLMNEMTRCMEAEGPDDVPEEPEEWNPLRNVPVQKETGST